MADTTPQELLQAQVETAPDLNRVREVGQASYDRVREVGQASYEDVIGAVREGFIPSTARAFRAERAQAPAPTALAVEPTAGQTADVQQVAQTAQTQLAKEISDSVELTADRQLQIDERGEASVARQAAYTDENVLLAEDGGVVDPEDLQGTNAQIDTKLGVNDQEARVQQKKDKLAEFDIVTNEMLEDAGNRRVSLSKITGIQREIADKMSLEREAIAGELQAEVDVLTALMEAASEEKRIAEKRHDFTTQLIVNNPGAGITYADSPEEAAEKIEKYAKKMQKKEDERQEKADKKAYKSDLKSIVRGCGMSTKGLSSNELERAAEKCNKEALDYAKSQDSIKNAGGGSDDRDKLYPLKDPVSGKIIGYNDNYGNEYDEYGRKITADKRTLEKVKAHAYDIGDVSSGSSNTSSSTSSDESDEGFWDGLWSGLKG